MSMNVVDSYLPGQSLLKEDMFRSFDGLRSATDQVSCGTPAATVPIVFALLLRTGPNFTRV